MTVRIELEKYTAESLLYLLEEAVLKAQGDKKKERERRARFLREEVADAIQDEGTINLTALKAELAREFEIAMPHLSRDDYLERLETLSGLLDAIDVFQGNSFGAWRDERIKLTGNAWWIYAAGMKIPKKE